jgi:hypothetical protein
LLIKGIKDIELSIIEAKANASDQVLKQQQSKCIRLNQCTFFNLQDLGVTDNLVMGINTNGYKGELFYMQPRKLAWQHHLDHHTYGL